jgi:hypothetical protein
VLRSITLSQCLAENCSQEERRQDDENRALRRTFGPKREEVTGDWRKLHDEKLHNLYCTRNIIRAIKSKRLKWAGLVRTRSGGDEKCLQQFCLKPSSGRNYFEV